MIRVAVPFGQHVTEHRAVGAGAVGGDQDRVEVALGSATVSVPGTVQTSWVAGDQGAGRSGVPLPLARRCVHRCPGHRHPHPSHRPQDRERPKQKDRTALGFPCPSGLVASGVDLLDQARGARKHTLTLQENKARAVIAGEKTARTPRFIKTRNGAAELDEASLARASQLVGLKG